MKDNRGSKPGERRGGRQKGTPNKATASIREAAQKHGGEALAALVSIMREGESEQAKISAAKEILDRAYGKSTQLVGSDPENPLNIYHNILDTIDNLTNGLPSSRAKQD